MVAEVLPRMLTNRYRLESHLATGGMGRVYLATQLPLERRVAVKLLVAPPHLKGDFRKRFLLEASVCAKLTHPNIVVVHDYGESDQGGLFMAMELLEGRSLSQVLKEDGPLPPVRVTRIALQIARALRQAHRGGVAHRDLKPGNVFLERQVTDGDHEDEIVKVLDFGLVKVFEESRPDVERDLTQGGMMMGSPRYMSPEQITCEEVDARSDIYSLGALIHALVCGRPPYVGASTIEVLTQHLQADPPTFEQTFRDTEQVQHYPAPNELQAIVHRCLRKDKADRYQSIDDLIRDLKVVIALHGDTVESTSTSISMPRLDPGTIPFETLPTPTPLSVDGFPAAAAPKAAAPSMAPKLIAVGIAIVVAAVVALLWPSAEEPTEDQPTVATVPEPAPEPVPEPTPEPTVEETPPAAPETVRVVVTSEPPGAEVMTGGVLIGRTPVTHTFPPTSGNARRVFDLTLDGHRAARV
ncbi:MAG: serine/threonine protein kinase, partial [Myxococcales bacterium]|nr:serine/threonine protein kinase [Myxococcales bacterium]